MDSTLLIFKALANRNRLRIFASLMQYHELCACQFVELLQVTGATASRHLSQLVNAGLVKSKKEGRWVYYRLNKNNFNMNVAKNWLKEELSSSDDYFNDLEKLKHIMAFDRDDLCRKQRGE